MIAHFQRRRGMMGDSAYMYGDQTTQYVYGTTLSDSLIASSQLKRAEIGRIRDLSGNFANESDLGQDP